jgi:flagellar hook-associated protein 2
MAIGSINGLASGIQWADLVDSMMSLESSRRLKPIQDQISAQKRRSEAWNTFQGLVTKLQDASTALKSGSAFGVFTTSVANSPTLGRATFTATTSTAASPGTYGVKVDTLAKATKLGGGPVADADAALGHSGTFHVNGAAITVSATDSLRSIRDRINAANSGTAPTGVSATILSTGTSEHRLVLTADSTGTRGVELVDSEGPAKVLQGLGLTTAVEVQNTKPGDPTVSQSQRFANDTTSLKTLLGLSAPPAQTTITIDGQTIQVDLTTDTMLTLMNKVAAAGGAASVEKETVGSKTMSRLSVTGAVTADAAAADPAASQRVVELLGFTKNVPGNEISAGADAKVQIDGYWVNRRSNTISDAIPGVTLTLTEADPANTVDLTVTRNPDAQVEAIQSFATAYNGLVEFVEGQRETGSALYASGSLRSMMSSITGTLLKDVEGLASTNPYSRASVVGVMLSKTGMLEVDATKLKAALASNSSDVKALFSTQGVASDAEIRYVTNTSKSMAGTYAVDITQAATVASITGAGFGGTYSTAAADTMTLTDTSTGKVSSIQLEDADTLAEIVDKLNVSFGNQGMNLTAAVSGGQLKISGTQYGTAASFQVAYTAGAGGDPAAQLGLAAGTSAGLDVAGTIGGIAATGAGQILTGGTGGVTEGISVRYSGSIARNAGTLDFSLGLSGMMAQTVEPLARFGDGQIALHRDSIDVSVASLTRRSEDVSSLLERRRDALTKQFVAMEEAMARLQSTGSWLSSQITAMQAPAA